MSDEAEESKKSVPKPVHLKTKPIPAIIMLLGGAAVAVDVFIQHFTVLNFLIAVFVSLLGFLFIGEIVKLILDRIELPNKNAVDKDGEMIEKGQNAQTDNEDNPKQGNQATGENGVNASEGNEGQAENDAGPEK